MMLSEVLARAFRWLSRLRGDRVFHPMGVAFAASWRTTETGALAGMPQELDAVVRLSRGVGLPPRFPDVLGLAVKVLDAGGLGDDLDLLLARSGSGTVGRRLLIPARSYTAGAFSSLLPYAVAGPREAPITAVIREDGSGSDSTRFEDLRQADGAPLTITLSVGGGPPIAAVRLGDRLDDAVAADLRFDPSHHGGPLRPTGVLNRLRMPVYAASQDGRGAPDEGARRRVVAAVRGHGSTREVSNAEVSGDPGGPPG